MSSDEVIDRMEVPLPTGGIHEAFEIDASPNTNNRHILLGLSRYWAVSFANNENTFPRRQNHFVVIEKELAQFLVFEIKRIKCVT